jgi:hypothetical protein
MAMASHSGWKPSRWLDGEPHFDSPFGDDDLRVLFVVARLLGAQCVSGVPSAERAAAPAPSLLASLKPSPRAPSRRTQPESGRTTTSLIVLLYAGILVAVLGTLTRHPVAAGRASLVAVATGYALTRRERPAR